MSQVDLEGAHKTGLRKEIGSIVHAIELEIFFDEIAILIAVLIFLNLDAELETQFIQPLELVFGSHQLEETFPLDLDIGHLLNKI